MRTCQMKKNKKNILSQRLTTWAVVFLTTLLTGCASIEFAKEAPRYCPPLPTIKQQPKLALVLGGGGARGLAHVGVIEELTKANIQPDLIVGCSAGAIVGTLYADSLDITALRELLMDKKRSDFIGLSLGNLPYSVSEGAELKAFLKKNLSATSFEDLKIPTAVVATNLQFGDLTPFATGEITTPVLASAAFPGAIHPVKIEGQYFVDGGVADPVPVSAAKSLGAEFVIAIELKNELPPEAPNHILGLMMRTIEIGYNHHSFRSVKDADFLIRVPFREIGTFDDSQNQLIYEAGKAAAKEALPRLLKALKKHNLSSAYY